MPLPSCLSGDEIFQSHLSCKVIRVGRAMCQVTKVIKWNVSLANALLLGILCRIDFLVKLSDLRVLYEF